MTSPIQFLSSADIVAIAAEVPWDFSGFEKLLAAVDGKNAKQATALAGQIACKAGCHHCCRRIPTILPIEWAWIQAAGAEASGQNLASKGLRSDLHPDEPLCGHLDAQGLCSIYAARPLICRTHGSLILSDEGLDHCPWNFQELEEVDEDMVFRLENLHETLLRLNLAFLRRSYPTRWRELSAIRVEFQA
jgi:Fe-S-cluster containining protein